MIASRQTPRTCEDDRRAGEDVPRPVSRLKSNAETRFKVS